MLLLLVVQSLILKQAASFTSVRATHPRRQSQSLALHMTSSASPPVPRAAVSVVVRYRQENGNDPRFVLIQRGQEPNKGLWSLPGGKLEFGETTLKGAQRELQEECQLLSDDNLEWYEGGAICVTDYLSSNVQYSICTCFAAVTSSSLPSLIPSDDAADAKWRTLSEIKDNVDRGETTEGVLRAVQRAEQLYETGLL